MKRFCISALGLMACANVAMADTTFTNGNATNNWSEAGNWSAGVPDAADLVTIPANKLCIVNVTGAVADRLDIASTGELRISAGKDLTLDNTNGAGSVIDGLLQLKSTGAVLRFIDNDHPLTGAGDLWGEGTDTQILIEQGITVESQMVLEGAYTIDRDDAYGTSSNGFFDNYYTNAGTVNASNGDVVFAAEVTIDDDSGSVWKVDSYSVTFNSAATSLVGNFTQLNCGSFIFNANIYTCGTLKYNGLLDVNGGAVFKYASFDGASSCGNPKDSGTGGCISVFTMFTVSSDHDCCP